MVASLPSRFSRTLILLAALAASSCGVPAFATCPSTPTDCGSPTVDNITVLGSVIGGSISGSAIVGGTMNGTAINGGSITGTPIGLSSASSGTFTTLNATTQIFFSSTISQPDGSIVPLQVNPTFVQTSGANSNSIFANFLEAIVGNASTQNFSGEIVGVGGEATLAETSGTITKAVAGDFSIHHPGGGTLTSGYGITVDALVSTGTTTKYVGAAIAASTAASNNTDLLLGTLTIPTGNFSLYNADTALSHFAGPVEFVGLSGAAAATYACFDAGGKLVSSMTAC